MWKDQVVNYYYTTNILNYTTIIIIFNKHLYGKYWKLMNIVIITPLTTSFVNIESNGPVQYTHLKYMYNSQLLQYNSTKYYSQLF